MATMSDDQFRKARLKARDRLMRLTLWKLRQMRDKYVGRPRTYRLAKELRALRSMLLDVVPEARKHQVPEARKHRVPEARSIRRVAPEARQHQAPPIDRGYRGRESAEQECGRQMKTPAGQPAGASLDKTR